jgi:hypothetical protein
MAAGQPVPGLVLDLDATIVICHSEKESATSTWKNSFGCRSCEGVSSGWLTCGCVVHGVTRLGSYALRSLIVNPERSQEELGANLCDSWYP